MGQGDARASFPQRAPGGTVVDLEGPRSCPECGVSNGKDLNFCVECGTHLEVGATVPPADRVGDPDSGGGSLGGDSSPWASSEQGPLGSPGPFVAKGRAGSSRTLAEVAAPALARLVTVQKDGTDGQAYSLRGRSTDLGRTEGDILLGEDPYLSDRHARFVTDGTRWRVRDLDSTNGVYLRLRQPTELQDGDMILLGQQVLRFERLTQFEVPLGPASREGVLIFGTPEVPRVARLAQYTTEGIHRNTFYLYRDETMLGRENGDMVFPDDPFMSRRHAELRIDRTAQTFTLRDMGSSNGTSVRVRGEVSLVNGDHIRVGRHLLRLDVQLPDAEGAGDSRDLGPRKEGIV